MLRGMWGSSKTPRNDAYSEAWRRIERGSKKTREKRGVNKKHTGRRVKKKLEYLCQEVAAPEGRIYEDTKYVRERDLGRNPYKKKKLAKTSRGKQEGELMHSSKTGRKGGGVSHWKAGHRLKEGREGTLPYLVSADHVGGRAGRTFFEVKVVF